MSEEIKDIENVFEEWETVDNSASFFDSEKKEIDTTEKKEEPLKEEEKKDEEIKKDIFKEFEETTEDTTEVLETVEDNKKKEVETPNIKTLNFLKKKGIIQYEENSEEELTEDKAEELIESSFEEEVENRAFGMMKDLPEVVKNMIKYSLDGGDVENLINKTSNKEISKDLDLTKEANQIMIIEKDLKAQNYDDDYIETNIEFLKESGKLETLSKKVFEKQLEDKEHLIQQQVEEQKIKKLELLEKQKQYKNSISNTLEKNKQLKGFKFSLKDKREMPSYISDKSVKLENGNNVSQLQYDIFKSLQDPEKTLVLAKLLKEDFNTQIFEKQAENKIVKEIKNNLQNTTTPSKTKKSLVDLFD